jgi:hypothetical protein
MLRTASMITGLALLSGCGTALPPSDIIGRSTDYYEHHPDDIAPMQAICSEWAQAKAPPEAQPAVVTNNCRAAAQAKSRLSVVNPFTGAKAR